MSGSTALQSAEPRADRRNIIAGLGVRVRCTFRYESTYASIPRGPKRAAVSTQATLIVQKALMLRAKSRIGKIKEPTVRIIQKRANHTSQTKYTLR